jgi:methylated-DNA-protein-cysteine methyltransferase-like protein
MDTSTKSPFTRKAKAVIRAVPRGRVVTYGQEAALARRPRAARAVAWILHSSSAAAGLPWHRVINARGGISLGRGRGFEEQRTRLIAEGVEVGRGGRVDLKRFLWAPTLGLRGILELSPFKDIFIASGAAVGGGSTVYANTLYVPPDAFFGAPAWAALADWKATLLPFYRRAQFMLARDCVRQMVQP